MSIPTARRGWSAIIASILINGVLTFAAQAAPAPVRENHGEPSIVPLLLSGRDSSHVAIDAWAVRTPAVADAGDATTTPARTAEPLTEAASSALQALRQSHGGKTLSPELEATFSALQTADSAMQDEYRQLPDSSVSKGLGLQDLLRDRVQQRLADWQQRTGPMMKALPLLRATPNAKGLQSQIEETLQGLLQPSKSLGALSGSQLPVHRPGLAPTALSLSPTVVPSYADPTDPLPQADDLLPSGEVQFSAGVLGKAQSLGYRYIDLFDFVRSEVRTEWSSGSTQSPDRTLHRAAGNDVEQASLLISLLRASGAAARYVVGVIEVPVGDLAQQIGVPEASVGRALNAAGIANRPVSTGGRITTYQLRHVWVSARVPYGNYRGTVADTTEPTWIPLMPAVKPAVFDAGIGVYARLGHDMSAWLENQLGNVTDVLPWDALRLTWSTALATLQPPLTLRDVASRYAQNADAIGLLPASTPYPVVAVLAEYSQLPDTERQWLHVRLRNPENTTEPLLMEGKFALSALRSERFTLAYLPATVEDQHMTNANGALGAFPLNLLRLRPSLMSEGLPALPGHGEVAGGSLLEVEIELQTPNGSLQHRQRVMAGSIAGFAIDAHGDAQMEAETVDSPGSIPAGGVVLNRFAQRYLAEWAKAETESADLMGVRILRPAPALAFVAPRVDPVGVAGLIDHLEFQGVTLDAALRPLEPIALHQDARLESDWLRLVSLHGSALESRLYEQLWGVASVSADRLLQQAAAQGMPILRLSAEADLASLGAHAETVRTELAHWLAQGMVVHIPQSPQSVDTWQGSAWRVEDPLQGTDGYFLSGGYAGGSTATAPGLWYFQDLVGVLSNPYAEPPNEDPLAGALIQIAIGSQDQVQSAGQYYEQPLAAHVLDITGRPVQGAAVTFRVREGDATLGGNGAAGSVLAQSDRAGTARVTARAPVHGQELSRRYLTDEAGFRKRAYVSQVEVTAPSARGELRSGQDLHLLMVAGPLHELRIEPAPERISTIWVPLVINGGLLGAFNGWTVVMPRIQTVATDVIAEDAFGNRVGSQLLSISTVDNSQEDRCDYLMPETGEPILPGAVFTTASLCPGYGPFLDANSCLSTQMETRTNADGVLDLNLVPSNRVRVATTLNVAADGVLATHTVKTTLYGIPPHGPDSCVGIQGLDNVAVVEAAVPDVQRVAKVGELFPRDRQVGFFVETQTVPASIIPIDPVDEDGTIALSFDVRGGTLGSLRRTGFNWFEFDVTAGATPGKVEIFADFPVSASTHFEQHLSPGWAVRLDAPVFEPAIPRTDEFGRLTQDLVIRPGLLPLDYFPQEVRLVLSDADSGFEINCESPRRGGCILNRGTYFPANTLRVHYIVNPNSENPLVSEDFSVDASARIVAGYGGLLPGEPMPSLDRLAGERFPARIEIQTEIDTQTDYVCQSGNRFMFALGYAAQVDLEIFNVDQNGARAGSHLLVLDNASYEAGVYEEDLGLERLPFGAYEFEIRARTEGDSETHTGYLVHREKRRGSLPLAHSVVKGVDVHDGHAVLSAEDIVIGGRGPGLRFSRTYSSHSGDDQTLLGRGWQSELDAAVVRDSCNTYIVTGAAGQGQRYVPDGHFADGTARFKPGNGFHGTLRSLGDGAYDFYSKDGTRYHFAEGDVSGVRLSFIEDPSGNRVSYDYGLVAGQRVVTRMLDGAGRELALDYETLALSSEVDAGDGSVPLVNYRTLLTAVRGPGALIVRYHYDAAGNLIKVTRSEWTGAGDEIPARVEEYAYHDYGGMWLAMPDDTSHYFHLGYRLTQSRVSSSNTQRDYTWQVGWSAIQVADGSVYPIPEMRVESLSETDAGTVTFAYTGLRPLTPTETTVTDARGYASRYEMNRLGATERLTTPAGITLTEWDLLHLQPSAETDVLGTRTSWTYDPHGNRLSETRVHESGTLTRQWRYVDPDAFAVPIKDRLQSETDARDIDTEYSYDSLGRRLTQTRGGVTESQQYNAQGDLISHTDGSGAVEAYTYDVYGHRSGVTDALGPRLTATFDARDRKLSESNGAGELTEYRYDALDRVRSVTHAAGTRRIDYDDATRTRTESDELARITTFVHDGQGRLIAQHNALSDVRSLSYDVHGNLLSESDFRGNVTQHTYDAANRRVRTEAPLQRVTDYQYNALGQVTREHTEGGDSAAREVQTTYAHPLNLPTRRRELIADGDWAETTWQYDGNGNQIAHRDAEDRVTTQTFDARDRLIQIDAPGDRIETFTYDGADRRIASTLNTDPVQSREWSYDARGRETRATDATGGRWEQSFDLADRLVTRSDPLGGTLSYTYDAAGRLERESGPRGGQFTAYSLDAVGNRVGIRDAAGRELVNTYDALNRLQRSSDAESLIERLDYDADGHVLERENGRGEITRHHYDALGYETRRDLPANQAGLRRLAFTPGIYGELLSETDANGNTTTHTYDGLGRRTRSDLPQVSGNERTRHWTYDRVGNLLTYTDAADRTTTSRYSPRNQRIEQTDPSPPGTTQSWNYDVAGNLLRHSDRRGIVHSHRYDGENRPIAHHRDGQRIETLSYDAAGRVLTRTDARGEETHYQYDAGGSLLSETRAQGVVQHWTYTPWGGKETWTDADGLTHGYVYDARQRLIEESDPAGHTTTHGYDAADRRIRSTRPGNAEWRYAYDPDGQLIDVESPEGHRTVYRHDKHGNRIEQRDAEGDVTRFTYDARHRLRTIDHPIGGDEHFVYNAEGELTQHTDRSGQQIDMERDGLGRLIERRYSAAADDEVAREVYELDGDGQPTRLSQYGESDGPHHIRRQYDGHGRLIAEDDRYGQHSTWTYDEVGNRLQLSDPAGTTVTQPDRLNRLVRLSRPDGSTELRYSPAGRLQQLHHPNGARSDYDYDNAGRIERITHYQGNSEVARFDYTYDARGNRQQEIRRDSTGTQTTDYAIDQDDRLIGNTVTDASGSVTTTAYTLDGVGNRLHETVQRNGSTLSDITYHYQAQHRLIDTHDLISGLVTEYTYDERGQLISETTNGQTTTYRPNAQDRLATLTLPGAPPVDYRYDPEGKRVERRTATDLTRYGWDGPHLRRETNVANNLLDSHDWAAGQILQSRHLTTTRYAQHDAQGSPTRWSAAQGQEQGQLHYDAWGKTTATSPDLPRIAYTGHYRDPEDDRYYAQQRDYRPSLGRFTRIDPWEGDPLNPITLNKYLYANGNPLYYTDPTGMYGQFFDGTWNDDRPETIAAGTQTNVYRLSKLYDERVGGEVDYQRGVGTSWISKVPGGATGLGARSRINIAYGNLVTWYNSPEARDMRANDPERWEQARQIDVFGFSRGAAQAREFANVVKERGIPNRETGDNFEGVNVRFLGLFDTVGSMGVPGNNVNLTYDLSVDPDFVRNARHAVAADEFRLQFDLSSIGASDGEMASEGFEERYFRGAHSDIGGGHAAGSQGKPNSLARATLRWMHREASEAGVPLKAIFGDDSSVPDFSQFSEDEARALLIHDSRRGVTGTLERLINRQRRTIYYSDGRKASVSRAELIERAREDDRSEAQVVKEGDGQLILEPVQGDD